MLRCVVRFWCKYWYIIFINIPCLKQVVLYLPSLHLCILTVIAKNIQIDCALKVTQYYLHCVSLLYMSLLLNIGYKLTLFWFAKILFRLLDFLFLLLLLYITKHALVLNLTLSISCISLCLLFILEQGAQ